MDQSTPGPPVFHCLPDLGQIHVGCFNDTVQTSRPLSSSSLAFTLSQHQGLFQGGREVREFISCSHPHHPPSVTQTGLFLKQLGFSCLSLTPPLHTFYTEEKKDFGNSWIWKPDFPLLYPSFSDIIYGTCVQTCAHKLKRKAQWGLLPVSVFLFQSLTVHLQFCAYQLTNKPHWIWWTFLLPGRCI